MGRQRDRRVREVIGKLRVGKSEIEILWRRRHRIPTKRAGDIAELKRIPGLRPRGRNLGLRGAEIQFEIELLLTDDKGAGQDNLIAVRSFRDRQIELRRKLALEDWESGLSSAINAVSKRRVWRRSRGA